jgi:phage terminase large subunit-like protein
MNVETAQVLAEDFLAWAEYYALGLFPWQREAFGAATRREAGRFVHRLAGISVPRGNGKSWGGSAAGVWRLRFGPQPQLILSCALDYEGARVCLDHGKRLLRRHPELESGVEVLADEVRIPATGSRWLIRSRDHLSSRGLHPDVVIYDEVGWARDDELFASLLAAQASVLDPLMLVVSTVGRRRSGPLWRIKELAEAATETETATA